MNTLAVAAIGATSVLVVEDEAMIAMELRSRLSKLGFQVVAVVDSGEEAIRSAQKYLPDLILMDVHIKGDMDGIETAKKIRALHSIPVIYLTAHSDGKTLQRAKESNLFGYVLKPFKERDLLVAIETAVHRHSLEKQLRESEQKYTASLASIGDGVAATDAQGRVTFMNAVAERLTGWQFHEARDKTIE